LLRPNNAYIVNPANNSTHKKTLIWLHGLGDSYNGFKDLFENLQLPNTRIVIPNAPNVPVTINGGMVMPAWYDIASFTGANEDQKGIEASGVHVTELLDYEAAKLAGGSKDVILGGFSQGAAMSLYAGLGYNKGSLAGIVSCSGYLLLNGQYPDRVASENKNTPVLAYHGKADPVVVASRAEKGYNLLMDHGLNINYQSETNLAHSLSQRELQVLQAFFIQNFKLHA
jgi:predicted esterase